MVSWETLDRFADLSELSFVDLQDGNHNNRGEDSLSCIPNTWSSQTLRCSGTFLGSALLEAHRDVQHAFTVSP